MEAAISAHGRRADQRRRLAAIPRASSSTGGLRRKICAARVRGAKLARARRVLPRRPAGTKDELPFGMSVICGIDFTPASLRAAGIAARLASRWATTLDLAHVVELDEDPILSRVNEE